MPVQKKLLRQTLPWQNQRRQPLAVQNHPHQGRRKVHRPRPRSGQNRMTLWWRRQPRLPYLLR